MEPMLASFKRLFDEERARQAEWKAEDERAQRESESARKARDEFTALCRPAGAADYTAWLIGYLRSGREPKRLVDRNLADSRWWVLTEQPKTVPSLYGADALNVIVPERVRLRPRQLPNTFHGRPGHSTFYFMMDFAIVGDDVPVHVDVFMTLADQMGWNPNPDTWKSPREIGQ